MGLRAATPTAVDRAFTFRRVQELRPRVEELTASLFDGPARAAEAGDRLGKEELIGTRVLMIIAGHGAGAHV